MIRMNGGRSMKKNRTVPALLILAAGAILLAISLSSCNLLGASIDERIVSFESDLNSASRATIYRNFHPTETSMYNQIKDPVWWDGSAYALADQPFSITGVVVDEGAGTATASFSSDLLVDETILFQFAKDGPDWQIESISIPTVPSGLIN